MLKQNTKQKFVLAVVYWGRLWEVQIHTYFLNTWLQFLFSVLQISIKLFQAFSQGTHLQNSDEKTPKLMHNYKLSSYIRHFTLSNAYWRIYRAYLFHLLIIESSYITYCYCSHRLKSTTLFLVNVFLILMMS